MDTTILERLDRVAAGSPGIFAEAGTDRATLCRDAATEIRKAYSERDAADENNLKQAALNAELVRDIGRLEAGVKRISDALSKIDELQNLGDARLADIIKAARAECQDVKRPLLSQV